MEGKAEMKQRLEQIAASGVAGSGVGGLREGLQKLGDPALLNDLDQLEQTSDPEQVKAIAQKMAAGL
jgi:hypothetical protein